jgi:hypothetical protein
MSHLRHFFRNYLIMNILDDNLAVSFDRNPGNLREKTSELHHNPLLFSRYENFVSGETFFTNLLIISLLSVGEPDYPPAAAFGSVGA